MSTIYDEYMGYMRSMQGVLPFYLVYEDFL